MGSRTVDSYRLAEEVNTQGAERVLAVIDAILDRPEHEWFEQAKKQAAADVTRAAGPREAGESDLDSPDAVDEDDAET